MIVLFIANSLDVWRREYVTVNGANELEVIIRRPQATAVVNPVLCVCTPFALVIQ
jgi:hypothetical protein